MPRIYFTGRRKIAKSRVAVYLKAGRPLEFQATIDLARLSRPVPRSAKVVVEAYHNTMVQRFDFGVVGDCRPRGPLRLTNFDEWDRPRFRVLVVGVQEQAGVVLAACDHVDAIEPEEGASGGRSKLTLRPKPDSEMRGELWKLCEIGSAFELWYNKDVNQLSRGITGKQPEVLGLILPAALRQILERVHLWEGISTDVSDWTDFAVSLSGEPLPMSGDGETPSREAIEEWIDNVTEAFCRHRARFVERIASTEDAHQ